jgi:hypothetical protein
MKLTDVDMTKKMASLVYYFYENGMMLPDQEASNIFHLKHGVDSSNPEAYEFIMSYVPEIVDYISKTNEKI